MTPREYAETFAPALASEAQDRYGLDVQCITDELYSDAIVSWPMAPAAYPLLRREADRILREARGRRIILDRGSIWHYEGEED